MPPGIRASSVTNTSTGRFVGPSVFFLCFLAYLLTAAPGITFWDSSELALGAFSLGLSHPPAYPVFCLTGKLFTLLPFGNIAYRTNLLSAFLGAASVWLLYFLITELLAERPGARWLAGACALLFGFYKSFWGVSVITEVYTLNTFLLLSALTAVLLYEKREDKRFLLLSSFLTGMALANHQGVVFFLPPYAAYFLLSRRNYKNIPLLAAASFFFLLAYSVNIYLPLRASTSPLINIGDPVIFPWFLWVMKWTEYADSLKGLLVAAGNVTHAKLLAAAAGLAAFGALAYAARRRPFILLLAGSAALNTAGIYVLTSSAQAAEKWGLTGKFYIPAVMFAVPLAAAAAAWAAGRVPAKGGGGIKAVSALVFAGAAALAAYSFTPADNSRNFFAYDFGMNTLKSASQDAVLFGYGDNVVFPVWYLQRAERYRDDVLFIYPEILSLPWTMAETRQAILDKYGIQYDPPFPLKEVKKNVQILRLYIRKNAVPMYFDFSTVKFLESPFERLKPQGLTHLAPFWPARPLAGIWESYVVRGLDGSTDRRFAAEGILDIYAWEAMVWAQDAYGRKNLREALTAYEYAKKLGLENPYIDGWAKNLRDSLKKGKI